MNDAKGWWRVLARSTRHHAVRIQVYDVTGSGVLLQEVARPSASRVNFSDEPTPTVLRVTYHGDRASALTWVLYVE